MKAGGGGATTRFVYGYLTVDPLLCGPILESVPPLLKVNIRTDRSGRPGVDVVAEGSGGYRGRRGLRVRSGVQPRLQARVRRATGQVPPAEPETCERPPAGTRYCPLTPS